MNRQESQFAIKLLPSLADFAFLMPVILLFGRLGGTKAMLGDGDTGWHIRTGEWMLANHAVPHSDIFSFSMPGRPWFAWEWLSDVLMGSLFRMGGMAAVVLASVILLAVTFGLLYRLLLQRSHPLIALPVTMIAAAASSIHWLARPHLITLLFLVVFLGVLESIKAGNKKLLWPLPVLALLWTNLHGGFLAGWIVIGAYAAGELITMAVAVSAEVRQAARAHLAGYLAALAGCVVVSFINPYSYHLHTHLFQYLTRTYEAEHITEFMSLNFRHPVAPFIELMLAGGIAASIWKAKRGQYYVPVMVGMWAHQAMVAARNIPILVIVAAPFIAEMLQAVFSQLSDMELAPWWRRLIDKAAPKAIELDGMERIGRWHLASFAVVALTGALMFAPNPPRRFRSEYDPKSYPAAALTALHFGPEDRIFTHDEWGDYLIWRLYPRTKVFVDGRSDFYGPDFEDRYLDVYAVKHNWEQTLQRYGVNTILVPAGSSFAGALKLTSRWPLIYDDGVTVVFRAAQAGQVPGTSVSIAPGGGMGRDREITKTRVSELPAAGSSDKSKT